MRGTCSAVTVAVSAKIGMLFRMSLNRFLRKEKLFRRRSSENAESEPYKSVCRSDNDAILLNDFMGGCRTNKNKHIDRHNGVFFSAPHSVFDAHNYYGKQHNTELSCTYDSSEFMISLHFGWDDMNRRKPTKKKGSILLVAVYLQIEYAKQPRAPPRLPAFWRCKLQPRIGSKKTLRFVPFALF